MPRAGQRKWLIEFQRGTASTNDYGEEILTWPGTTIATRRARIRFGTAQEKREAAQEGAFQTATFECVGSIVLDGVTLKDRIWFDNSAWDLSERAPLSNKDIRFTGTRKL